MYKRQTRDAAIEPFASLAAEAHMWEDNDDAWTQHARHYPDCHYLLLRKGKEFVDSIKNATSRKPSKRKEKDENKEEHKETSVKEEDEEQQLRSKVCYTEPIEVVLIPCRHFVASTSCTVRVRKCPLCRSKTRAYVRAYL